MTRLSVVVPAYRAGEGLALCLRSLAGQEVEVIVVESSGDGTAEELAARFPAVRFVTHGKRLYPGAARNLGILHATGDLIALLDADCQVGPEWAQSLRAWHQRPAVLATGLAAPEEGAVAWAAWFCTCVRWAPENPAGARADLPSASMSFPRSLFARCGPFLEEGFSSDTAFCWAAARQGYELWFEPAPVVRHDYRPSLRHFLARQAARGRAFAKVRRAHASRPHLRWLGWAWPGLAAVLFARTAARVWRHRIHTVRFALLGPLVLAGLGAWAWGEARGYRER